MTREDLAIAISIASAAITTGGLLWQLILYRLSGARLHVTLTPCVLDSSGGLLRGPAKGWVYPEPQFFTPASKWNIELADVTVTNIGRTAVSVSNVALDFGRLHRWRRWRHTIQGTPLDLHESNTENKHRLEPGDSVRVLFDLWQVVESARKSHPKAIAVRGTAQTVGRRARRSSWRLRWKLANSVEAMRRPEAITPELRAYRALWRNMRNDPERKEHIQLAWFTILPKLNDGVTVNEIEGALRGILGPGCQLLASDIVQAYAREASVDSSKRPE